MASTYIFLFAAVARRASSRLDGFFVFMVLMLDRSIAGVDEFSVGTMWYFVVDEYVQWLQYRLEMEPIWFGFSGCSAS